MPDELSPEDQAWLDLLESGGRPQPSFSDRASSLLSQAAPYASQAADLYERGTSLLPPPFAYGSLNKVKDEYIAPVFEAGRRKLLAPLTSTLLQGAALNRGEDLGTALKTPSPQDVQRALPVVETAVTLPFIPTPARAASATALGRVAATVGAGVLAGGAQAMTQPRKRIETGMLEGGLMGGLFGLGVEGLGTGLKAGSKLLGKLRAPQMGQLAEEGAALAPTPEAPRSPSYAVLMDTPEGAAAKVVEMGPGGLKARAMMLRTTEEVARAKKAIGDAPVIFHPSFDPKKAQGLGVPKDWDTPTGAWMDMDLSRDKGGVLRMTQALGGELAPGAPVQVSKASGQTLRGTIANILPDGRYEVTIPLPRIKTENLISRAQAPFALEQAVAERLNRPTLSIRVDRHQLALDRAVAAMESAPESFPSPTQVGDPASDALTVPDMSPLGRRGTTARMRPPSSDELTIPQLGRDPRSGAVGAPGGGAGQAPGQPPAFDTGDLVYLDEASPRRTTPYTTVKVLGPGQQGKVMVQVTSDQGNPLVKEVEPSRLTHAQTVPPVTGAAVKPPLPSPLPGTIPQQTLDEFNRTMAVVNYAERNPGVAAKVKNFLMAPGLRPGEAPELARKALSLRAARRIEETGQDNLKAFRAAAGRDFKMLGEFDRDLEKVVLGKAPSSSLQKHGPLWDKVKQQVQDMLQERDYLNDKLVSMGYVPDELQSLRATGDADLYAARMYYSKLLKPGEWAKHAPQKVLIEGQDFLRRQAEKRGVFMTDAEVGEEVRKLLGSEDPLATLKAGPLGQPFQHLKKLQDLPEPLRNLMGEVHSGIYRLSTSLGIQRSLVSQLGLMEEIAANPQWASVGPQPGFVQLPNLPAYGKARNLYVAPEVAEAVVNLPDTLSRAQAIMQSLVGMTKANIITTAPRAHARQAIQSFLSGVLAGGVDVTRPVKSLQNLRQAAQVMRAYSANPSGSGLAELMQEAKALGAVDVGFGAAEIKGAERKMLEAVSEAIQSPSTRNLWGLFPKLRSISEKFYDKAGRAYEAPDQFFRLASYLQQREKLINSGMPVKVAREEAARRVAMSFVSPGNVSDAVNKLRRGGAGVVNPFLTPIVEDARIAATLPERLRNEPDLKWRLGVTGMLMGAGYAGLKGMQHLNGISDEEVNAARAIQPRGQQSFRTAQLPLAWRDENGRVQFMDMSWMHTGLQLMRGDPTDSMWQRVLAQTLYLPVSGGGLEEPARKLVETSGLVTPQPPPPELREGEAGLMEVMRRLNATGLFGPTVIGEAARTGQQAGLWGYQSPNREVLTPLQGASKFLGVPVAPVTVPKTPSQDSPSLRGSLAEDRRDVGSLKKQYKSPAATDQSREAIMKKAERIYQRMSERDAALQKFQQKQGGSK